MESAMSAPIGPGGARAGGGVEEARASVSASNDALLARLSPAQIAAAQVCGTYETG
jgi:hypothetical protein